MLNLNTTQIRPKSRLLLAVSGGVDSMVLLDLCLKTEHSLAVAHCNFQLREEAKEEQQLVEEVAKSLSIPICTKKIDTKLFAQENKISTQMAARELRYAWFQELAEEHKFDYILTAHHLNDQIETMILNFVKGSGIEGVSGIPELNGNIVRPLLSVSKEEIYAYARENKIQYLEDKSNQSDDYERNFIRNQVIPMLKEINPGLAQTLSKSTSYLQFANENHQIRLSQVKNKLIHQTKNGLLIYWKQLQSQVFASELFYEIINVYNFSSAQSQSIFEQLKSARTGAIFFSETHQIVKDRERIIIAKREQDFAPISINESDQEIEIGNKRLAQAQIDSPYPPESKNEIQVDADMLEYPLLIRKWLPGDYFYPIGLNKKQKLKRYFSNEKFSAIDKQNTRLLCSGDKIVWVVGHRMDHRFRVTEKTKRVLNFIFN